jgi:hypothetical protein
VDRDPELLAPVAKDREQALPADRGEPMPARGEDLPVVVNVDVVPGREILGEPFIECGVGVLDASQRLVGKDDPEPKGVVCGVSLPDLDLVVRVEQLDQRRQVESSRPAADDRDAE